MTRLGRLLSVIVALAGFATAHVLAQEGQAMQLPTLTAPTLTTPTLTTPTLTTPTVTTPTVSVPLPPPPAPAPTPTVSVPTVSVPPRPAPAPAPAPAPTPAPAPAPALPAVSVPTVTQPGAAAQPKPGTPSSTPSSSVKPGSSPPEGPVVLAGSGASPSGSASGSAASGTPATAASGRRSAPRAAAPGQRLAAKVLRTKRRVSVRLTFALPAAGRVFLVVRGPAPSCRVAGYIPVRGRRGANVVAFSGRVHGRRLEPGVYLISISPTRRPVEGAPTEYVRVVSPKRSVPLPDTARKPSCRQGLLLADAGATRVLRAEAARAKVAPARVAGARASSVETARAVAVPAALPTVKPLAPAPGGDADGADEHEGAAILPGLDAIGEDAEESGLGSYAAVAALTVVAALLFAMLALVARFLRGSWNP